MRRAENREKTSKIPYRGDAASDPNAPQPRADGASCDSNFSQPNGNEATAAAAPGTKTMNEAKKSAPRILRFLYN